MYTDDFGLMMPLLSLRKISREKGGGKVSQIHDRERISRDDEERR